MVFYTTPQELLEKSTDIYSLRANLTINGCKACDLGFQKGLNGCCVSRGNPKSKRMIIGEGPGKYEDARSIPFIGPAGQLLDKIFASVGFDTNKDFYLTNIVICRPIAAKQSGKENYTPKEEQITKCRPYLSAQIGFIQPSIIVTMGRPATESILNEKDIRMKDYRGRLLKKYFDNIGQEIYIFCMFHPATLLHSQKCPSQYQAFREQMWDDIRRLKQIIKELNL